MLALTLCLLFGSLTTLSLAFVRPMHLQFKRCRSLYLETTSQALDRIFSQVSPLVLFRLSLTFFLLASLAAYLLTSHLFAAIAAGISGFFLPLLSLKVIARQRRRKLREQIVDGLQTIANALRAGFSLTQALQLVSRHMSPPLSQEFALLIREHRMGVSLEEALIHLRERVEDEDIDLTVSAILLSREVGGNLAETLDRIAETVRERTRLQGKVHALTAQGRLQAMVMGSLPVLVGLALHRLDPDLTKPLLTQPLGQAVLGMALFLEVTGIMLMRRLSRITM